MALKNGGLCGILLLLIIACMLQQAVCYVDLPPMCTTTNPCGTSSAPVTNWLLTPYTSTSSLGNIGIPDSARAAWRKIGAKLWYFLSNLDHDWVDASGNTVPPTLAARRAFGPSVSCGRFARQWIRMPFHDCGTFDIGATGSEGDTGSPRFGCNASLRKEVGPCLGGPGCWNGVERRFNLSTGAWMNETAFKSVEDKFPAASGKPSPVDWAQDADHPRFENSGFAMSLSFFYQVLLEHRKEQQASTSPVEVSFADLIIYAGMLATAKCKGPHIEFQPGRTDATVPDGPHRLPDPTEPLPANVAYFWANGVTNFDMVILLAAHSTACFGIGCLDRTPSRYDFDWATLLLTLTNGTDSRICQFDAEGNAPKTSRLLCFLPADAEFAARADTRAFLRALTTTSSLDISNAANNLASPFNPWVTCPKPLGSTCQARSLPVGPVWSTYRLRTLDSTTSVNLCKRTGVTNVNCPSTTQSNLNDAVATSIFKMSKWYPGKTSLGKWIPHQFGVVPQPCQPGLTKIGADVTTPLEVCNCCPTPLPQTFSYVAPAATAAVVTPTSVITEAGPAATAATTASDVTPIDPAVIAATADVALPGEPAATAAAVAAAPADVEAAVIQAEPAAAAEAAAVVAAAAAAPPAPAVEDVEPMAAEVVAAAVDPTTATVAAAVEAPAANMVQGGVLPAEVLTPKSRIARNWAAFAAANPFNPLPASL